VLARVRGDGNLVQSRTRGTIIGATPREVTGSNREEGLKCELHNQMSAIAIPAYP